MHPDSRFPERPKERWRYPRDPAQRTTEDELYVALCGMFLKLMAIGFAAGLAAGLAIGWFVIR